MLKLTLKSGKEIVIREMNLADQRAAAKNIGSVANEAEMQIAMQQELLKLILVSIDGKTLKGQEKENLSNVLSWQEYNSVLTVVQDMLGNEERPKVEMVTSSSTKE